MEAVAAEAAVTKRTVYARYAGKAALFEAAVAALIAGWRPGFDAALDAELPLEDALRRAGIAMLRAATTAEAVALYRLIVAESGRFPEIARSLAAAGAEAGIAGIASLLARHGVREPVWAAEQFQRMVIGGPQARALGLGAPLEDVEGWVLDCVRLFLHGLRK